MTAQERRIAGINSVNTRVFPPEHDYMMTTRDTAIIAEMIRELDSLGRTERWHAAVEQWAQMVEEEQGTGHLEWAVMQGSVFASHAA